MSTQEHDLNAVSVGRCHVQTARDRYEIDPSSLFDPVLDASRDGNVDPNFRPAIPVSMGKLVPPRPALWRMNLTALSQRYNLYFVSYEGDVFVYRPRDAVRNILPTRPDYVLKSTPIGPNLAGHIAPGKGHWINNMVIGDLGEDEVLAMAFDNGNVVAYSVKTVSDHITALDRAPTSWVGRSPRPFFHQYVRISAWGISLHKKSRLIAVSCNYKTITVFYPALSVQGAAPDSSCPEVTMPDYTTPELAGISSEREKQMSMEERQINYRKIFDAPQQAENIPSVAFTSLSDGTADKIAGIDISGNVWVFSVWGEKGLLQSFNYNAVGSGEGVYSRGWGLLMLPSSSFLPVYNLAEAFRASPGTDDIQHVSQRFIGWDISLANRHIPDNILAPKLNYAATRGSSTTSDEEGDEASSLMTSLLSWPPGRSREEPKNRQGLGLRANCETEDHFIFRVSSQKLELQATLPDARGVASIGALLPQLSSNNVAAEMWLELERLNHLLHIPELSLIVVGSIHGHVALVRLTKTSPPNPQHGFRIEWTLPRRSDVECRAMAPLRPLQRNSSTTWFLHGIAVSPVPESHDRSHSACPRRRFRLMLHYYNHTILSYELTRDSLTNSLVIL